METTTTTNVELCPRCRASIALTSYILPFEGDFARAYHNPSRTDSSSIESSLTDQSAELTTLAQEIQRVELLLSALKTHHAHLERHIHRTTRFIQSSPVRQLPTEVLGIIFALACTSFQENEYKTPLSISLVCSKWRDISISTPALWTNIYVAPYSSACGMPVYEHFLRRCGGIPISVKVEVSARDHPDSDDDDGDDDLPYEETYEYHVDVMGDVYVSFAQWKHAEFHMKGADIQLLEDLDGQWLPLMEELDAPILESLTLAITDAPETPRLPSIFRDAPLLATVNFLDCCEDSFWTDTRLPWQQLRRVQTDQQNAANLRYLSKDFQDGESRTLVLNGRLTANFYLFPQISFTLHITTLILNSQLWTDGLCAFLRNVSIPTLKDLTVISRDYEWIFTIWYNPLLVLPVFLEHAGCRLDTFSLVMHGRYGDTYPGRTAQPTLADSLVDVLRVMDHLKYLQVIEADLGPPLLNKRLFEQLSADTFLPELTSLELVWAEDRQPDRELLSALSSRADGCLSSVVLGIRNGGNLGPEVLECMRGLRQKNVQATCW